MEERGASSGSMVTHEIVFWTRVFLAHLVVPAYSPTPYPYTAVGLGGEGISPKGGALHWLFCGLFRPFQAILTGTGDLGMESMVTHFCISANTGSDTTLRYFSRKFSRRAIFSEAICKRGGVGAWGRGRGGCCNHLYTKRQYEG